VSKVRNIAEGWLNFVRSKRPKGISIELAEMANKRAEICKSCPFLQQRPITVLGKKVSKYRCGKCGCAFPMMVYASRKKCPIGKWPK
jgi:transposase-like protein